MFVVQEVTQAIRLAQRGCRAQAMLLLQEAMRKYPADFRPWWAMAHLSEEPDEIRAALEQVLHLNPDQAEARERLAALDQHERQHATAI